MTRPKVRNPGVGSIAVLGAMLMVALGGWGNDHIAHGHMEWGMFLEPQHVFSLFGAVGAVLGAWLSKSPLN